MNGSACIRWRSSSRWRHSASCSALSACCWRCRWRRCCWWHCANCAACTKPAPSIAAAIMPALSIPPRLPCPHRSSANPCSNRTSPPCRWSTSGKVRDIYAVGDDKLLIVTTDRLSAFDVVMPTPIPGKGEVLTPGVGLLVRQAQGHRAEPGARHSRRNRWSRQTNATRWPAAPSW